MKVKESPSQLHAFVAWGADEGKLLFPHLDRSGKYVVSTTRFAKDQRSIADVEELLPLLEKGWKLRMSNPAAGVNGPRLIEPGAIYRPVKLNG